MDAVPSWTPAYGRPDADVTTAEGAEAALAALPDADILVNNLGIFGAQPALDITDDDWRRYFEVNVLAAIRLTPVNCESAVKTPIRTIMVAANAMPPIAHPETCGSSRGRCVCADMQFPFRRRGHRGSGTGEPASPGPGDLFAAAPICPGWAQNWSSG